MRGVFRGSSIPSHARPVKGEAAGRAKSGACAVEAVLHPLDLALFGTRVEAEGGEVASAVELPATGDAVGFLIDRHEARLLRGRGIGRLLASEGDQRGRQQGSEVERLRALHHGTSGGGPCEPSGGAAQRRNDSRSAAVALQHGCRGPRSEEHTSELRHSQISYAGFRLKKNCTGSSSSIRFRESESRRRSPSISMILTFTPCPCATTSRGLSTWCAASSAMCSRISTPERL